jgi:hypothetical protein
VGLEVGDPVEAEQPEVDGDNISAEVRVVLNCAECGTEMKEWNSTLEEMLNDEATIHKEENPDEEAHVIEAEWEGDPEISDEYRPRHKPKPNKKGVVKPVPYRYQIHYYKLTGTINLSCSCGATLGSVEVEDEMEASGFDELN